MVFGFENFSAILLEKNVLLIEKNLLRSIKQFSNRERSEQFLKQQLTNFSSLINGYTRLLFSRKKFFQPTSFHLTNG